MLLDNNNNLDFPNYYLKFVNLLSKAKNVAYIDFRILRWTSPNQINNNVIMCHNLCDTLVFWFVVVQNINIAKIILTHWHTVYFLDTN